MISKIIELIGTVAFSVSGTLVSISCGLDLFGVLVVGCVTAVGGGMLRDLLLGNIPPHIFSSPEILLLATVTSLVVFIISYINSKKFSGFKNIVEHVNILFDSVGLAVFSVAGVEIACTSGFESKALLSILSGVTTGVGGGVLRDVLVNEKPYILTKHIYAIASILGSLTYYLLIFYTNFKTLSSLIAICITVCLRLAAAKYRWKLPKIKFDKN